MAVDALHCPLCRLVSPPRTILCDCGYDFVQGEPARQRHLMDRRRPASMRGWAGWGLVALGGICFVTWYVTDWMTLAGQPPWFVGPLLAVVGVAVRVTSPKPR